MDEFTKLDGHYANADDDLFIEVAEPIPAREHSAEIATPDSPPQHGALIPDTTQILARIHAEQNGLTVYGNISPSGFTGTIVAVEPLKDGDALLTGIDYMNNCPIGADRWLGSGGDSPPLPVADAVATYERTAAALAATPEVQALAERMSVHLKENGVDPETAGLPLATGKKLVLCQLG